MSNYNCSLPEAWDLKTLGTTINVLTDYTANGSFESLKNNVTYYSEPNYAVLVRTTDLGKSSFEPQRFTDEKGYNFQRKTALYGGEIVLANVGSVGSVYLVPKYNMPMTLAPNTYLVKCNDTVDQRFVFQFLISEFYLKGIYRIINSTALPAINKDNFRSIPIALPPTKKEQVAIRNILETIDQTIEKTEALIEKYQQIKAGLMYDLFTRGITADGKLRPPREQAPELYQETPIGWIPKEWKIKLLDDLTNKIVDGVHHTPKYVEHGIPFVTVKNLTGSSCINFDKLNYIDEKTHRECFARADPKVGDVLVTKDGTLGVSRIVKEGMPEFSIFVSVALLRVIEDLTAEWLHFFFDSNIYLKQLGNLSSGTGLKHIHLEHFKKFKIALPDTDEQKRIVAKVKVVEEKVSMEKLLHSKMSKQKLGLMHDLLTGNVPVIINDGDTDG